ncbi:hypothetical protein BD410DRAFT_737191 [Rickenella mellea]|uniref:Uncharacterized protein n=1 Tax=Rickenella mellea TaxID=50990 RepID=A0A4R5XHQ0_9AGAM|nr:hypothetical protein BD410DRAFT_737191 [Rickenella mellea]
MTHKLPDEVLKEILAPPLVISDDDFSFTGDAKESPFGRTPRHSSSLLLVCKHWMRVATPLLYEVAVIRSTAQAQALAYAITSNKVFGTFIKRLRMEGGFGKAPAKFITAAPNIRELFITADLWSSDNPSGLCSALSGMNPHRLIVTDSKYIQNTKAIQLWDSLCTCVGKWSNMKTLEYHATCIRDAKKSLQLFRNLRDTPSIKHIVLNQFSMVVLTQLADISSLETIRLTKVLFNFESSQLTGNPRLLKLLQFKTRTFERHVPAVLPFAAVVADFTPLTNVSHQIAKFIWDLIFSFATWSYQVEKMSPGEFFFSSIRSKSTSTARSLSLVSKSFHDMVRRHLFAAVHIRRTVNLAAFNLILKKDDSVGPLVRVLRVVRREYDTSAGDDEVHLAQLLPMLTGLISLNFSVDHPRQLKSLSQVASTSLRILALEVRLTVSNKNGHCEFEAVNIGDLIGLTHLECSFEINSKTSLTRSTPTVQLLVTHLPNLTSLDTGQFSICGDGLDLVYGIRMPSLTRLCMSGKSQMSVKFLKLNGQRLKTLNILDTPSSALLKWCPQLESLTVGAGTQHLVASILRSPDGKPYLSLSQLRILYYPRSTSNLEKSFAAVTEGFEDVDFSLFPNLKEVHWDGLTWPNTEREIKKNPSLGSFAHCLKTWGVTVYDKTGTPWRERAQIRRGR